MELVLSSSLLEEKIVITLLKQRNIFRGYTKLILQEKKLNLIGTNN